MTTLTVTIRDEDQHFIESAMKSGRYVSESEAVADAFAELRSREAMRQARFADLRAKVQAGIDEIERGEGQVWDVEKTKAEARALFAARKSTAA